jgi:hypothetical protein
MIPTVREPKDTKPAALEHCYFCNQNTPYWHPKTNKPVCHSCAKTHKVSEIIKHPNYKPMTKEKYTEQSILFNQIELKLLELSIQESIQYNKECIEHFYTKNKDVPKKNIKTLKSLLKKVQQEIQ